MTLEFVPEPGAERIRVVVDPDLADLVPGFVDNRRADVASLRQAIERQDYKTIHRLGHNLKGDSGALGFHGLTLVGRRLEQAALDQDDVAIITEIARLSDYLERVEVVPPGGYA